ncbi:MAG: fibronectin type III domain-containing protein [Prevotella sp.]|nr:fibronectin type III domain-containing protein [Prevotella sp.]
MKRIYEVCRVSAMCVFFVCLCLSIVGCSKDDGDGAPSSPNGNTGSDNTKDIAVTGSVEDITPQSASIKGYINVDQAQVMLIQDFGVEYSTSSSFYGSSYAQVSGYTGREFVVWVDDLEPNTTYYYRTYVHQLSGLYHYGQTLSFKTETVKPTISDVSYTQATINARYIDEISTLYYSKSADGPFDKYEYLENTRYNGWQKSSNIYNGYKIIEGLEPGTTYYCYLASSGNRSETVSFTTKSLPFSLSGTTVACKYAPDYNSYVNQYGRTVDLKWLSGTYTVTVTTDASKQYKYGILAISGISSLDDFKLYRREVPLDSYLIYSTDTQSPYNIKAKYAAPGAERIGNLLKLVKSGEASDDDLYELDAIVEDAQSYAPPYLQAFIEIDGERIYVGSVYHNQ